MSGLAQHDVLVAVVSAVVGGAITGIPAWIAVTQTRKKRLRDDINDAVNAKIGDLVGGTFANLTRLQRDLESQATRAKEEVQHELEGILSDARRTITNLRRLAAHANQSVSEIDVIRATASDFGVDFDQLLETAEKRKEIDSLANFRERQRLLHEQLTTLLEEKQKPERKHGDSRVKDILRQHDATDAEHAAGLVALEIVKVEDLIKFREGQVAEHQEVPTQVTQPYPASAPEEQSDENAEAPIVGM